jgi:NAD(P)-dependent dehydrogenase (short-subunit alcohol dehydrogenase family)
MIQNEIRPDGHALDGRVVIVTGASSGLGEQLARALQSAGATAVLVARREDRLARLREQLPGADAVTCDVTDPADRERMVETVVDRHGRLDGLVNNAGAGATGPALKSSTEAFARVLDLNLTAPFALSCLAATRMRAGGGGGSIVNVASVMGLRSIGEIPDAAYVASKAGVIGLTRELASQWGRHGIRVNAVAPGFFASEMTAELGDDPEAFPEFLLARTPLRRGGRAGELDEAVLYLLGAGSSFVTGHVLSVDGGMSVR